MNDPTIRNPATRPRRTSLLWAGGAVASIVLALGVTGTLSTWTSAIVGNGDNSAASADSVALVETQVSPAGNEITVCDTADNPGNTDVCPGINTYGGLASPLDPDSTPGGDSQSVTVNLQNDGTATGDLTLDAAACSNDASVGSTGTDLTYDLCTQMVLDVTCTDPGGGADHVIYTAGNVEDFVKSVPGYTIATLDATTSTQCTFTVTLPTTTPSGYASQFVSQVLTWKLDVA
jgi:hypothetical protein